MPQRGNACAKRKRVTEQSLFNSAPSERVRDEQRASHIIFIMLFSFLSRERAARFFQIRWGQRKTRHKKSPEGL